MIFLRSWVTDDAGSHTSADAAPSIEPARSEASGPQASTISSNFDAAALLKDWTATGHGCRTVQAVGVDNDVAAQGIGPLSPAANFANLPNPASEIRDRVFDLLKPSWPPTVLFGRQLPPHLPAKRQHVLHLTLLMEIGLSS
jgi:hypothetical protein